MKCERIPLGAQGAYLDTYFLADSPELKAGACRPAVVVCPGGGYAYTSDREAEPIALALCARGFHACVLRYPCAPARFPAALRALAEAVAWVRAGAAENHVDPRQISVCGFSAGGHLAGSLGVFWNAPFLAAETGLAPQDMRPDKMVLCYPVITGGEFAHKGSFDNLLGADADAARRAGGGIRLRRRGAGRLRCTDGPRLRTAGRRAGHRPRAGIRQIRRNAQLGLERRKLLSAGPAMKNTTLCYIEQGSRCLMLHRTKKANDENEGKWIGVGGKCEEGESPEDCLLREVREETGLMLTDWRYRGLVTFVSDVWPTEYMHLFTSDAFEGTLAGPCVEGELAWVEKSAVPGLPLWEGDRIFLRLLAQEAPFFSLKLVYRGSTLVSASLNGRPCPPEPAGTP